MIRNEGGVTKYIANYNTNGSPAACEVSRWCKLRYEVRVRSRSIVNYATRLRHRILRKVWIDRGIANGRKDDSPHFQKSLELSWSGCCVIEFVYCFVRCFSAHNYWLKCLFFVCAPSWMLCGSQCWCLSERYENAWHTFEMRLTYLLVFKAHHITIGNQSLNKKSLKVERIDRRHYICWLNQ